MRNSTGTIATACALSATLLVAGCGGVGGKDTKSSGEVFLQPAAAQGPEPFTGSTASPMPRVTRTPRATPAGTTSPSTGRMRAVSGATPGLYGGTARTGSCDVERQIADLTADRAKAHAFAGAEGISQAAIPAYLRGLTSVVLRADTQVTNHGFRGEQVTGFQSVLQAGTAVLVDDRGVPRVRCACGNPLKAGVAGAGSTTSGRPWSGFRPAEVVVVTPAPQVITNVTIIDIVHHTWIERPLGHRGTHDDHVVPVPAPVLVSPTPAPRPSHPSLRPPHESASGTVPPGSDGTSPAPSGSASAAPSPFDCANPAVAETPGASDCLTATVTARPPGTTPTPRGSAPSTEPPTAPWPSQDQDTGSADEIGPPTVPETPDLPDGGGLIPDDTTSSIFDSPTNVFAD
ncbi:DUF6777 domain-containing protein [Streptomyces sp. NPDC005492]|uniref:DUF6777 domain-containing protein n=1 Tax=Streptomyces sp. NPDC005492 TaxID=3156883 RepID=UPI0033B83FF2